METSNPSVGDRALERPWHAAYQSPKTTAAVITREDFHSRMFEGKVAGKDFVLVDLGRMDLEVRPTALIIGLLGIVTISLGSPNYMNRSDWKSDMNMAVQSADPFDPVNI